MKRAQSYLFPNNIVQPIWSHPSKYTSDKSQQVQGVIFSIGSNTLCIMHLKECRNISLYCLILFRITVIGENGHCIRMSSVGGKRSDSTPSLDTANMERDVLIWLPTLRTHPVLVAPRVSYDRGFPYVITRSWSKERKRNRKQLIKRARYLTCQCESG